MSNPIVWDAMQPVLRNGDSDVLESECSAFVRCTT
jgi:hypothetical protein